MRSKAQSAKPLLSRAAIHRIFRRHPGAMVQLAEELGITVQSVSMWMMNKGVSARIAAAAERRALELYRGECAPTVEICGQCPLHEACADPKSGDSQ